MAKEKGRFDDLIKEYGQIIRDGQAVVDSKPTIIPVSPAVDIGLGGGICDGMMCVLGGREKIGKTTLALWIAANAQKLEYKSKFNPNGRDVYYLNIEGRLKPRDLDGIPHLDRSRFFEIGSSANDEHGEGGKILNAQEYLSIAEKLIHTQPGCVIIIDSFSFLVTEEELSSKMNEQQRANGAKLLYKFCRKVSNVIPVNKTIVIGIIHVQNNVTGYGSPWTENGGNAIKFAVEGKLIGKSCKPWEVGDKQIGQMVDWNVACSPLGPPGSTVSSYIRYGSGIDKEQELANICADLGIISKAGAWFSFPDDDKKIQGMDKVRQHLVENPDLYNKLFSQVKEFMGIKY